MALPFKLISLTFLFLAAMLLALSTANAGSVKNVTVGQHQAEIVSLPGDWSKVIIADRSVAGVVRHSGRKASIIGHKLGNTDIRFMQGNRIVLQVGARVTHDLPAIREKLSNFFPDEDIRVEHLGSAVALSGSVTNAETARNIVRITEKLIGQNSEVSNLGDKDVVNLMKISSGQQVMLRVQVGEIKRETIKNFGLGAHGVISQGNAMLGALENDKLFKVLAEPNLVAISGETADFLAGGEIPLPVPQGDGTMSVTYKPFGVGVKFTPFVLSEDRIRLIVNSEVSELGDNVPMTANTYSIPSISTRRAQTTVELAPGESFMIAGLIKDNHSTRMSEIPGLGSIPILSALFRSTAFQRNETELVIAVTPYIVEPIEHKDLKLPTDDFRMPSTMEMIFFGSLGSYGSHGNNKALNQGLEGPVGFMLD